MGTKTNGKLIDPCLEKIQEGEKFFVLREQDLASPEVIRYWAKKTLENGKPSKQKIQAAYDTAEAMESSNMEKKWAD